MKYIKKFNNQTDYQTFKDSSEYIEPHLVGIVETKPKPIYKQRTLKINCKEYSCDGAANSGVYKIPISNELDSIFSELVTMVGNGVETLPSIKEMCGKNLEVIFQDIEFLGAVRSPMPGMIDIVPKGELNLPYTPVHLFYDTDSPNNVTLAYICIVHDTNIQMADGTNKKIQDISYDDNLLVWDFDNGCFTSAKPLWIKKEETAMEYYLCEFENGTTLKLVGSNGKCHRVFNYTDGVFESATDCVGKEVYTIQGITRLVNVTKVYENVKYYNIITEYHMNLFANEVLTSCRYNNIYPIENMKFIGVSKNKHEDIPGIPSEYVNGMRLKEQSFTIDEMTDYINNLINLKKE